MSRKPAEVRHDPELGPTRYCRNCGEWWPLDAEFWYVAVKAGTVDHRREGDYVVRKDRLGCLACKRRSNAASAARYRARAQLAL